MSRKRIAVLTASIDREYQRKFGAGLAEAGAEMGVDVYFFNSQGHPNYDVFTSYIEESMIYDLPDLSQFDGVISMMATMGSESVVDKLQTILGRLNGKPHVSIDVPMDGAVCVTFDDRVSVEALTEHLILQHGAKRFAFVSGPLHSDVARFRVEACRDALRRHGLALDDALVFDGLWTRVGGAAAAKRMLESGEPLPDVVMCGNDDMAISVIECFEDHGVCVPKDVAVTGFDALDEAMSRGVTTISRPIERAAREAMRVLCDWMAGHSPAERMRVLPTVTVCGESCGCHLDAAAMNRRLRALSAACQHSEFVLTQASMFFSTMTCVANEGEARRVLREFATKWGIREMYLCVDPAVSRGYETGRCDPVEPSSGTAQACGYPQDMLLLYGIRGDRELPLEPFRRSELIPDIQTPRERAFALVFCPLYYRGRNYGYVALELGEGTGLALYSILMLLSGTLMSLYLQANLRKNAAMVEMTIHDIMTGLLNRRGFAEQAPAVFDRARREGRVFAMLSADMDHLKSINDVHGHLAGDEAIRRMGKCMLVLEKDGMTSVHISGDEFLAYGIVSDSIEADGIIARIRDEIERSNRANPWICRVGASLGVYAAVPQSGETIDDFMVRADRAMYADKNQRRTFQMRSFASLKKGH